MHGLLTIMHLTWTEARRMRITLASLICALLLLAVFGTAVYFMHLLGPGAIARPAFIRHAQLEALTLAGLYVANFLTLAFAVLLPVDSISGEIESGVIQTIASKPVSRSTIVLGKWLAFLVMVAGYLLLVTLGVVLLVRLFTGFVPPHLATALPLLLLGAATLLTLSIAGGTRLKTITNAIVVFGFYAIAFIGGWIETIGAVVGSDASRYIGTAISLVSPVDALWRLASHGMQSPLVQQLPGPFSAAAVPSEAMVVWSVGFVLATLLIALRGFRTRAL
ncbi:MAG TPA: ABC transporter permease [Steroidobacteraceae bacterium]|nr:ABC transporter permease [Steroidobacteraceae bacterium]